MIPDVFISTLDFGEEPMAQDKWLQFNPQQKDLVDKYLSSLRYPSSRIK